MRVVVVGLGYVGSVCSACLASRGHEVVGVDTSEYKTGRIEARRCDNNTHKVHYFDFTVG